MVVLLQPLPAPLRAFFGTIFFLFISQTSKSFMTLKKNEHFLWSPPSVKETLFQHLMDPATMKELDEVSSSMKPSANQSGWVSRAFYVQFWPQLVPSLLQVVNIFLETRVAPPSFFERGVVFFRRVIGIMLNHRHGAPSRFSMWIASS